MAFFFGCLFATWIGRKIGWTLSGLMYVSGWSGWAVCVILCLGWGIGVAYALHRFIFAVQPFFLLKIFGYAAGAYLSIPNYGLFSEAVIPASVMPRHVFIKAVPVAVYIASSILFAFTISYPMK